jgi:hypothetical protein
MAAALENPTVPPPQEPVPDPIKLENDDSKPAPDQERANTSQCEEEVVIDKIDPDDATDEATRDSTLESESEEQSNDPIKTRARRAVVSAIGKMERFQEAMQFTLVGELHDLKRAVGDLPSRNQDRPPGMPPPQFQRSSTMPRGMPLPPGPPEFPGVIVTPRPGSPEFRRPRSPNYPYVINSHRPPSSNSR